MIALDIAQVMNGTN